LSVLQPKFANKLAAQELSPIIEADGLSGNGGSVRKLGYGDCLRDPVPVSRRRRGLWGWQGRLDVWPFRNVAAVIEPGMSSSIRCPCRPGSRRNVDSVYRFAPLARDCPGVRRSGHGSRVVRD
jgi:hypothetical protein